MRTAIYYFSGSGNSLAVAKALSDALRAEMIPIAGLMKQQRLRTDADAVGFVFPLYDFQAPDIVAKCIQSMDDLHEKYVFAVGTAGIGPLSAMKKLGALVQARGGKLSGGFTLVMPHNGVGSAIYSQKEVAKRLRKSGERIKSIAAHVTAGLERPPETSGVISTFILSGLFIRILPTMVKLLRQTAAGGWKSLALQTDTRCTGCGTCAKVCPAVNITMADQHPSRGEACISCLACLHWCPSQAVRLSSANLNIRQYHHPGVNLGDMLRQHASGT